MQQTGNPHYGVGQKPDASDHTVVRVYRFIYLLLLFAEIACLPE